MKMNKRGFTITGPQLLAVAILVIVFLVILGIVIGPSVKLGASGFKCETQGGICSDQLGGKSSCPSRYNNKEYMPIGGFTCEKEGRTYACCREIGTEEKEETSSGEDYIARPAGVSPQK
jgi:hypothetical protein